MGNAHSSRHQDSRESSVDQVDMLGKTLAGRSRSSSSDGSCYEDAGHSAYNAGCAAPQMKSDAAGRLTENVDHFLEAQKSERQSELKQIRENLKTVTEGKNRQKINRFLRREVNGEDTDSTTSESASSDDGESSHRSHQTPVRLEVRGLFDQRPVTSVLQSNSFRRQLENIIRGNVIRQERELETALRLRNAGLPGAIGGALSSGSPSVDVSDTHSEASVRTQDSGLIHPPHLFLGGNSSVPPPPPPPLPPIGGPQEWIQNHVLPPPLPPPRPSLQVPQQFPAPPVSWQSQQPLQHQPPLPAPAPAPQSLFEQQGRGVAEPSLAHHYREQIIEDITELVHNQLVTGTLQSNFRGTLEILMQNRVSQTGDGERVMNYIQTLPRDELHRRNDFSHLGIAAPAANNAHDAFDSSGVPSRPPQAWTQEMTSLRNQMSELQNMVRLSFDLQLDLQRAIRQEVAAALSTNQGNAATNLQTGAIASGNDPANEGHCIICLDKSVDSVLYQCGHMCVCYSCGMRLRQMNSNCPMCRAPIRDVIRAFKCHKS